MNQKRQLWALYPAQILVCLIGFVAGVVPSVVYTDPFWGVDGFMDKELFAIGASPGVVITQIASGSPAASIGLQNGDRIINMNGKQVDFGTFRQSLRNIQPGESIPLDVKRRGQEVQYASRGEVPTLDCVLFLDWQFVCAPVFLVLLLLLIATQPLDPPPLWRAILCVVGGLAVISVVVVVEVRQLMPWTAVWYSKSINHAPPSALHYSLALATLLAGLTLSILGAFSVRAVLIRRAEV